MATKIPRFRCAQAGEAFLWPPEYKVRVVLPCPDPPETGSPAPEGRWACISCGKVFPHNLAKDTHVSGPRKSGTGNQPGGIQYSTYYKSATRAHHVLAWIDLATGNFEVP